MIFTKETYTDVFDGYIIKGCAIQNENRQMYLLVEDNDEKIRSGYLRENWFVFTFNENDEPHKRFFGSGHGHLNNPKIAYNLTGGKIPSGETIGVDIAGRLYSRAMGKDREEEDLPEDLKGSEYSAVYTNIKTVGESMYAIGIPRQLFKRIGVNEWENLTEELPLPDEYLNGRIAGLFPGWRDIDGFSEQDMYLAGGKGEIWHYDTTRFKQCDFPSNELVANICCAGDGYIYVGGNLGRLWKGKDDSWKLVSDQEFSVNWKDIVWFKGRLFLGSDYGLWEFKDGEVIRAEVPDQVLTCSGSLSICPEKKYLLTAGNNGASMYDGKEWTVLFDRFNLPN